MGNPFSFPPGPTRTPGVRDLGGGPAVRLHAQTLRSYDGSAWCPRRATGGGRRYSARDISLLREVQRLSQEEGVNLAGIKRIIDLETRWTRSRPG